MKARWTNNPVYGAVSLLYAVLMLAWCVAYGIADHRLDQCRRAFSDLSAGNQALLTATRARAEKDRARQAALDAPITNDQAN